MGSFRVLIASASFAALGLAEGRALAMVSAITLKPTLVTRQTTTGQVYECPGRGPNTTGCIVDGTYQGIGYHDCADDSVLVFPLNITGLPDTSGNLQVWAGTTDCTQQGATNNNTTATCWMVAPPVGAPLPVTDVTVRVADIAGYLGKTNPNLPQTYMPAPIPAACSNSTASTTVIMTNDAGMTSSTVGEATVNVYFMWFLNSNLSTPAVSATTYSVKVKLLGPAAVTGLAAATSENALLVSWLPPGGDTTIQGYDLFAAPAGSSTSSDAAPVEASNTQLVCNDASQPGTELFDDAGNPVFDDAGNPIFVDDAGNPLPLADGGCYQQVVPTPSGNTCSGSIDTTGIVCAGADAGSGPGVCQQVNGPTNASATIKGLSNNTTYDVAVAAFDQYGNVGQISATTCGTPQPVQDFWKTYNQDGGNAFCALEVVGRGGGAAAAGLLAMVGLVFVKRRRRQDR